MIVFLDTNIVIYAVESHPTFGRLASAKLAAFQAAGASFMVSDLVRMECLVKPLRIGNAGLIGSYKSFFARPGLQTVSITSSVADRAAIVRAAFGFKAIDALQLAAAVEHGAGVFLTNDSQLGSFTGIPIEVL